ncbi:uncharacterized protein ARMOST_17545 [Armillaria ostoyae]|uniref:Uncharacterized protein n=1 Tax=Armillaria ostoyae TaxID=47428 RepID=A0A284RZE9_ARMOS|nr:uncharacterized protein ARMOST_17545 [Armillaria ostoyae]
MIVPKDTAAEDATSPSATSGADKSNLSPVLAANTEKEPKVEDTRDPLALIGGKDSEGCPECEEEEEDEAVSSEGKDEQLAETNTKTSILQLEETLLKSKIQSDRNRLLHENDRLLRELLRTRETLHNQQSQHQEDRRLLHSRGKELESTRTFLDKSDVHSLADVKSMVESLNSEIHQLAAYSADTLLEHGMDVITDEVRNHAMRQSQHYLDDRILALLIQREGHAGFLQIAFQAALLFECSNYLKLWALESAEHKILGELHARVQEFNTAAVAGRWRALTITMSKYHSSPRVEQYLLYRLGCQLENVILLGGWAILKKPEALRHAFGERIMEIVNLTVKLDRAIKEGITSQDLDAHFVGPGEKYDSETMSGAYGKPKETDEAVSCTCELGLKSFDDKGKKARLLLKAGVVVPSALV